MAENKLNLSSVKGTEASKFNQSINDYNDQQPDDEKLAITSEDNKLNIQFPEPTSLNITIENGQVVIHDENISEEQMKSLLSFFYNQSGVTNVSIPEDADKDFQDEHQETVSMFHTEEDEAVIEKEELSDKTEDERGLKDATPEEFTQVNEDDKSFNPFNYWKKFNSDEKDFVKHRSSFFGKYPQTLQFFKDEAAYDDHGKKEGKGKYKNNVLYELKQNGPNTFTFATPTGGNAAVDARYFDQTAKFMKKSGKRSLRFGKNLTESDRTELFKACGKRALIPVSPHEQILLTDWDAIIQAYKGNKNSNEQMSFDKEGRPIPDNLIDYEYRLAEEVVKAYGGIDKITPSFFRQKVKTAQLNKELEEYTNPKYNALIHKEVEYDPTISDEDKDNVLKVYGKAGVIPTGFVLESSDVDALIAAYAKNGFSGGDEARYKAKLAEKIREAHVANNLEAERNGNLDTNVEGFNHFNNFPNGELLKKLNYHIVENRWELGKGGEDAEITEKETGEKKEVRSNAVSFAEEYIPHTDAKIMQSIKDFKLKPKDKNELYTKCGREGVIPVGYSRAPGGGELSSFQGGLKNFHMVSSFIDGGAKYEDSDVAMDRTEKLVKNILDLDAKDFSESNINLVNAKIAEKYNVNSENPDDAKNAQGGKIQISKMFTEYAIHKMSKAEVTNDNSVDGIKKVSFPEYLTGGLDKELLRRAGKKGLVPVFEKKHLTAEYIEAFKSGLKENKDVAGAKNDNAYEQKVLKSLAKSVLGISDDKDYGDYNKLKEALDNKFGKEKDASSDSARKALLAVIAESNIYEKDNTDEEKTAENSINGFRKVVVPHGMEYNDNMKMLEKAAENRLIPTGIELDAKGLDKLLTTFNNDANNSSKDKLNYALSIIQEMENTGNTKLKDDEVLKQKVNEYILKDFFENDFRKYSETKSKEGPVAFLAIRKQFNDLMTEATKLENAVAIKNFLQNEALDQCKGNFDKDKETCLKYSLKSYVTGGKPDTMLDNEFDDKINDGSISVIDNRDYASKSSKAKERYDKLGHSGLTDLMQKVAGPSAKFDSEKMPIPNVMPSYTEEQIQTERLDLLNKYLETDYKKINMILESGKTEYINKDNQDYQSKLAAMMAINEVAEQTMKGEKFPQSYNAAIDKARNKFMTQAGKSEDMEVSFKAEVEKFDALCKQASGDNEKGLNISRRDELERSFKTLDVRSKEAQLKEHKKVERPKTSKTERRKANASLASTMQKLEEREDLDDLSKACLKMAAMDLHNDINEGEVSLNRVANNLTYYAKSYRGAVLQNGVSEKDWVESVNNEIDMFNKDKSNLIELTKVEPTQNKNEDDKKKPRVTSDNSQSLIKASERAKERNDKMRDRAINLKNKNDVNRGQDLLNNNARDDR